MNYLLEILGIKRRRFFELLKEYQRNPARFSIQYERKKKTRGISKQIERNITKELEIERRLIENKEIPVKMYNYSYIKDQIYKKYNQKVSLPTIIERAKRKGFYLPSKRKKKEHTREILTNYVGQLIQHHSSHHKFSPYGKERWPLITSLDDYSRLMLYTELVERETSWDHILVLQTVFLTKGLLFPTMSIVIPFLDLSEAETASGDATIKLLMRLLLNGSKSWMIARLK